MLFTWQSRVGGLQPACDSTGVCTALSRVGARFGWCGRVASVNPFERGIRTLDAWQQRHRVTAFTFAVFKKFGDDQAGNLVALLT